MLSNKIKTFSRYQLGFIGVHAIFMHVSLLLLLRTRNVNDKITGKMIIIAD